VDILDDMGVSKLLAKVFFFFKVNYSFKQYGGGTVKVDSFSEQSYINQQLFTPRVHASVAD